MIAVNREIELLSVPVAAQSMTREIISAEWDEEQYCKNCQQYGKCNMIRKPKLLACNSIAISYAIDAINGGIPFGESDIMKRPAGLSQLVAIATAELKRGIERHANSKR